MLIHSGSVTPALQRAPSVEAPLFFVEPSPVLMQVHSSTAVPNTPRAVMAQNLDIQTYFNELKFGLEDTLRLVGDPAAPEYISSKILGYVNYNYLSGRKGIHLTGMLLGLSKPWDEIAAHLESDKKELMDTLDKTLERRNDIVHRADRSKSDPGGDPQGISYVKTRQMADTVDHVCLTLDLLVTQTVSELAASPNTDEIHPVTQ